MTRTRQSNKNLPPCCYLKHGAYYFVRANKWTRLGATLPEAMAAYARLIGTPSDSMTALLDDTLSAAQARGLKPSTLDQYRRCANQLKDILLEFSVREVKPPHIAAIMDDYTDKPSWANRLRTLLKLAFDLAVRRGLIDANPVTSIACHKEPHRTRYLSDAEYRAIHAAASPPLRAIMALCYLTAQRIGDVLKIREGDITPDGITIDQEKTSKRLLIAWTPDLRATVQAARDLHSNRKLYLLGQRNGRIRSYYGVRDLWNRACAAAGITDAHLHDLRAKSLTDAKQQGLDPQHLAGHTTAAMTLRYLRGRERDRVTGPLLPTGEPEKAPSIRQSKITAP